MDYFRCHINEISDISVGNPPVLRLILNYNRQYQGQAALRTLLQPLINSVLANQDLHINTNPVEIYKTWINRMEINSGQSCELPPTVTPEEAMQYPEVKDTLNKALDELMSYVTLFLTSLFDMVEVLPYCMRHLLNVLRQSLCEKFPDCPNKEILKAVGHVLYYKYINSAIVAPEAYGVIDVAYNNSLTQEQRKNLANIAKILQFSVIKKGVSIMTLKFPLYLIKYIQTAFFKFLKSF